MPLRVIDRGVVFEGRGGAAAHCHIPSLCALCDGSILASYRVGADKMDPDARLQLSSSTDGGKTWGRHVQPFDPVFDGVHGSFWAAYPAEIAEGRILTAVFWLDRTGRPDRKHVNADTLGLVPTKTLLFESMDFGKTWSEARELDPSPFDSPLPVENGVFRLPDGALICFFESYKSFDDPGPWQQAAVVKMSHDEGRTWPEHAVAAHDPAGRLWYNDQRGAVLRDGRVMTFYFTFDPAQSRYVGMRQNVSTDGGRTWSEPCDTGIPGQAAQPVELEDGRIVLVTVDRHGTGTIDARLSADGGASWDGTPPLTVYSHASAVEGSGRLEKFTDWDKWDFGRPQAALLPDGDVMVVYYAGVGQRTGIHWARIGA